MPTFLHLLAPLALLPLAAGGSGDARGPAPPYVVPGRDAGREVRPPRPAAFAAPAFAAPGQDRWEQVRIEQRVIIRIAPNPVGRTSFAPLPMIAPVPLRLPVVRNPRCVAVGGIASVRPAEPDRLVLFLRDNHVLAATLAKACSGSARAFYSGFYVDHNADGLLCVNRDMIRSRSGTNCLLGRLREIAVTAPVHP